MSGIYSALAGLLIFTAMLVALGLAIDVPGMLHAGVPTADVKRDLETSVFRDFDDWPRLMRQAAMLTLGILLVVALPLLMFARRNFGGVHMVRGTLGVEGLMLAMLPLSGAFQRQGGWKSVGLVVSHKQYAEAADLVLQNLRTEHAVFAGVIFIVSIIILAWPPRKAGRSVAPHTGVAPPDKGSTPQGA